MEHYDDQKNERMWSTVRLAIFAGLMMFLLWSCSRPKGITYVCYGELKYAAGTATCDPSKAEG